MARKTNEVTRLLNKQNQAVQRELQRLEETKRLLQEAEIEDKQRLQNIQEQIVEIGKTNDVFIGVILSPANVFEILDLAIRNKGNITIPARVYYQPENPETFKTDEEESNQGSKEGDGKVKQLKF